MTNLSSFFDSFRRRRQTSQLPQEPDILARFDFVITFGENFQREFGNEYERLLRVDASALASELPESFGRDVRDILGEEVTFRIDRLSIGSIVGTIVLVLVTTASVYTYISQYHDFIESLNLVRDQLQSRITSIIGKKHPLYDTNIRVVLTKIPSSLQRPEAYRFEEPAPIYSKAFFWYLFFSNIFLLIVLGFLLYKAVAAVYFTP